MTGTYRHRRACCQVSGCRARAVQAVSIDLPAAWGAEPGYMALPVVVGLCRRHGREVGRRVEALLEARSELAHLLTIIDGAVEAEALSQSQLCVAEAELERLSGEVVRHRELAMRVAASAVPVAATEEAIRYEAGEDGPQRVAAWLVAPAHMEALRAALAAAPGGGEAG